VQLIRSLHAQLRLTAVLVTHDLDTLAALGARVAVLAERRIVAHGSLDEIMKADHPFIQSFFRRNRARGAMEAGGAAH
jgi:phospholipid/cholesterol/gamma-HCH transport system ATP-binding protein